MLFVGFNLRLWIFNNLVIQLLVVKENFFDDCFEVKVFGVLWNIIIDMIIYLVRFVVLIILNFIIKREVL